MRQELADSAAAMSHKTRTPIAISLGTGSRATHDLMRHRFRIAARAASFRTLIPLNGSRIV